LPGVWRQGDFSKFENGSSRNKKEYVTEISSNIDDITTSLHPEISGIIQRGVASSQRNSDLI
jgi:hypothetical protein